MAALQSKPWIQKLEKIGEKLSHPDSGLKLRIITGLVTAKVYYAVTGAEIVSWIQMHVKDLHDNTEAHHVAHMLAAFGFIYPIDSHILSVKNDQSLYRYQNRVNWLTPGPELDDLNYAIYLVKRSMLQKADLDDYESDQLTRLQKLLIKKWTWIITQAGASLERDKKRGKIERKISDNHERAFWDLHRPPPGCVNSIEQDVRTLIRTRKLTSSYYINGCPEIRGDGMETTMNGQISYLKNLVKKRRNPISKVYDTLQLYCDTHKECDGFLCPAEIANPWYSDHSEWWDLEKKSLIPKYRYIRWSLSLMELLKDCKGREEFYKFLESEHSTENIRFWMSTRELKSIPVKLVSTRVAEIYAEYLEDGAENSINVDSDIAQSVKENVLSRADRYSFDAAEEDIFELMKTDSYQRFLKSNSYFKVCNSMKKLKAHTSITSIGSKIINQGRQLLLLPH